MRTYWDTSAAINAAVSPKVFARLDSGEHFTRLHLFAEFFSTMTGRGVEILDKDGNPDRMVFTQNDCLAWLRKFAAKVQFVELTSEEALTALDKAQGLGVQGPAIYDYFHAEVSAKAKVDQLLTRNIRHFAGLAAKVEWP